MSIIVIVYSLFIFPKKYSMKYPESPLKLSKILRSEILSSSLNILYLSLSLSSINLSFPDSFLKDIIELQFFPILLKELFLWPKNSWIRILEIIKA